MYALIALLYLVPQAKGAIRGSGARDRSGNPFLSEARKRLESRETRDPKKIPSEIRGDFKFYFLILISAYMENSFQGNML
jgi:hypothetical protein